jgi:hypothetical protein
MSILVNENTMALVAGLLKDANNNELECCAEKILDSIIPANKIIFLQAVQQLIEIHTITMDELYLIAQENNSIPSINRFIDIFAEKIICLSALNICHSLYHAHYHKDGDCVVYVKKLLTMAEERILTTKKYLEDYFEVLKQRLANSSHDLPRIIDYYINILDRDNKYYIQTNIEKYNSVFIAMQISTIL